jgi:hypothetical protein
VALVEGSTSGLLVKKIKKNKKKEPLERSELTVVEVVEIIVCVLEKISVDKVLVQLSLSS